MQLLLLWLLSVVALMAVAYTARGFEIRAPGDAFLVLVVVALASTALAPLLALIVPALQSWMLAAVSLPVVTVLLRFTGEATSALRVAGWAPAFLGAAALTALSALFHWLSS